MAESTVIRLKGLEAAALCVLAESEGVTPETLLQNLLRDAAIAQITGRARRGSGQITVSNLPESRLGKVTHETE